MDRIRQLKVPLLVFALVGAAFAVFWPVLDHFFVVYDDNLYVVDNAMVRGGLSWDGLAWAFTTDHTGNWHPLTWLSHQLDAQIFGVAPWGHHLTNLVLHAANGALLFGVLRALTGATWRSALVAALFVLHPAHVESVAWVSERKDVLSTLFCLLTVAAYLRYARQPGWKRYALVLILFAAGLMSKPMVVTLPFALLLLDWWPLGRWGTAAAPVGPRRTFAALVREKGPLFALVIASCVVTYFAQRSGGAVGSLADYPLGIRLENSVVAYASYLGRVFVPTDLAVFYPHPGDSLSFLEILGGATLLVGVSLAALWAPRRTPYLPVGWFWFVGTLIPVIGLVQVGWQATADRYTYVPYIGLFVALVWGGHALVKRWRVTQIAAPALAVSILLAFGFLAQQQTYSWRESETLFRHALAVTEHNFLAHHNLGYFLDERGRSAEAVPQLRAALAIRPKYPAAHNNLGKALFKLGRFAQAEKSFRESLRLRPDESHVLQNLGLTRLERGDLLDAIAWLRRAAAAAPERAELHYRLGLALLVAGEVHEGVENLGLAARLAPPGSVYARAAQGALALQGKRRTPQAADLLRKLAGRHHTLGVTLRTARKLDAAILHLGAAVSLLPTAPKLRHDLALALAHRDRRPEAIAQLRQTLKLAPRYAEGHNDLGYLLFIEGKRAEAIRHYRAALKIRPKFPLARNNLRAALRRRSRTRSQP